MKIKTIKYLTIILLLIPLKINAIDIYSNNGILYNLNDDEIIYKKNEQEKVQIASLTKIMTAVVALENIEDINQTITLEKEMFDGLEEYAQAGFKIGDKVTYIDLLYGLMLPSGAECAYALSLSISNTNEEFVKLMNEKAKELNLKNTTFQNPIGIDDENNYSTVEDIAILLKYALKNPTFNKIFKTKEYITSNNIKLESTIKEKAKKSNLDVSNILGSKTGFTDKAGYCLASISKINNINYLLVTTNASTKNEYQVMDAINIYDYYSKNYSYKKILKFNQLLVKIPIKNSIKKEYKIYSEFDKYIYANNELNEANIKYEYEGIKEITKKTKQNEKIGKINIKYNNEIIYTYDIILKEKIYFHNYTMYLICISIIVINIIIKKHKKNKSNTLKHI